MDLLAEAREEINEVDGQLAALFERRMSAVRQIAEYKAAHGLPITDSAREADVLERCAKYANEETGAYYLSLMKHCMALAKQYQKRLLDGMRIAYSGVEGAFAQIAAKRIFPDGNAVAYPDFKAAYSAVSSGECDCAVLPIENSFAGEVGQVTDLMFNGDLYINGVYDLPVGQNLLGLHGATVKDIKRVISHPQALSQCTDYIEEHGFERVQAVNTAVAAKAVSDGGDISTAAIAGAEAAALYGLEILDHDINTGAGNTTRFAVLSRLCRKSEPGSGNAFFLMFTVNHVAGALAEAINIIAKHGFNMKALRSRPMGEPAWQYYFFVEAEGDKDSPECAAMLAELKAHCDKLKVVGGYTSEKSLGKGGTCR